MKILTLTTLYPNAAMPNHGVFVENRLRAFLENNQSQRGDTEIRVIAPVPWFPFTAKSFGAYAAFARAPKRESRYGIDIEHPRYLIPPKIGMTYAAYALERCFLKAAKHQLDQGWDFDLIDAHYLYPDGVAAQKVAEYLGKPIIMTARGTDVSLIPNFPRQKAMILNAVQKSDGVICVAQALKDALTGLGAPEEKITVLRNGVDLSLFSPLDKQLMRQKFSLPADKKIIASIGHLIARKGHDLVIGALQDLPEALLLIVGAGAERPGLEKLAQDLNLQDRVKFLGAIPHQEMAALYSAADVLALASSREGWPNVLLEAMACGAPAVAAPIWGCGEVITAPAAGRLAQERSAHGMAQALNAVLTDPPMREETRAYAEGFSWDETSTGLQNLFNQALNKTPPPDAPTEKALTTSAQNAAPKLIVTIDTEEAFDWAAFGKDTKHWVCPPTDITPFQELCETYGIEPLYFLTHPLLQDEATAAYFRTLHKQKRAALGLHLHQWTTPVSHNENAPPNARPQNYASEYYSFQKNLPQALYAQKLKVLSETFEANMGFRASAHRAGRYGVNIASYPALAAIGVTHDFSPSPAFDQSRAGGPNFTAMSNKPFTLGFENQADIKITPVCGARALRRTRRFLPQNRYNSGFRSTARLHGGVLTPRLTAPMRLTCEGTAIEDLKALARALVKEKTPVLTFSFHSTSYSVGGNPYAGDAPAILNMLETTKHFFEFFQNELGGEFLSLTALEDLYAA